MIAFDMSAAWESAIEFGNERRILPLQFARNSGQCRIMTTGNAEAAEP